MDRNSDLTPKMSSLEEEFNSATPIKQDLLEKESLSGDTSDGIKAKNSLSEPLTNDAKSYSYGPSRGQTIIALLGGIDRSKTYLIRKDPLTEDQVIKMKEIFGDRIFDEDDEDDEQKSELKISGNLKHSGIVRKNAHSRKVVGTIDAGDNSEMLNMLKMQFGFSFDG